MPVQNDIQPATLKEVEVIAQWLQDPVLWRDAFLLPTAPDLPLLLDGVVLVQSRGDVLMVNTRIWAVHLRTRADIQPKLVGFAVDYAWAPGEADVREVDVAFPGRGARMSPRLPLDVFCGVMHALFSEHGVVECKARTRASARGKGFPLIFESIGAELYATAPILGVGREAVEYAHYRATPTMFYASRWAKRCGLSPSRG